MESLKKKIFQIIRECPHIRQAQEGRHGGGGGLVGVPSSSEPLYSVPSWNGLSRATKLNIG